MAGARDAWIDRKSRIKTVMSFLAANIIGRIAGVLIDIFFVLSTDPKFLVSYFTAQACILFPFAVSSAFCVQSQRTAINGFDFATFAIFVQGAIIVLFAHDIIPYISLLLTELVAFWWLFRNVLLANLIHVFPWSGVAFNAVLLVIIMLLDHNVYSSLIVVIFSLRFVFAIAISFFMLPDTRTRCDATAPRLPAIVRLNEFVRFFPMLTRQCLFVNSRFFVAEDLLALVAIGGRVIQNSFVFLINPILLCGIHMSTLLITAVALILASIVAVSLYHLSVDIRDTLMASAATAFVIVLELRTVRQKQRGALQSNSGRGK